MILLLAGLALASTQIAIDAEVGPDLDWIRGTVRITGDERFTVVDPLSGLPVPERDLYLHRTFPGAVEQGVVRYHRLDDSTWVFHAVPPRRYGDLGAIDRFGLFANGAWYPQPLTPDGLPEADWEVQVDLPEGTTGALGDTWGTGTLRWEGAGERASLAVLRGGVVTPLAVAEEGRAPHAVTLLTRGSPRPVLVRELSQQLAVARVEGAPWHGVIVEAPLRRRLVRAGRGLVYVSDRAFRVSPGLHRFHRVGVMRGVMEGLLDDPDPFVRAFTAAGLSLRHARDLAGDDARSLLRWVSWIPTIDAILHSRTMPFHAEVLEDAHPGDPVRDDLVERFDPHAPGPATALQVDDRHGPGTAWMLAESVALGLDLDRAAKVAGVSTAWLDGWRTAYPEQDYRLEVQRDPPLVRVERIAPPDAPTEALVVRIDDVPTVRVVGPGPDTVVLVPEDRPRRVVVDPERHTEQTSRVGDAWPPRYHANFTAAVTTINLTELYLEGWAAAYVRRTGDTHNRIDGTLFTSGDTLAGASLRYLRMQGPLLDGLSRPHRFSVTVTPAFLSPRFSDDPVHLSIGAGLQYGWTNRTFSYFPTRGHALGASVNGGLVPATGQQWMRTTAAWNGIASPHPRHALALRLVGGIAQGDVAARLLSLGGAGQLRSIPEAEVVGSRQALGMVEYRVAVLRNASVPLLLAWGTGLQVALGAEAGTVWVDGAPKSAAGATVGLTGVGEVLGFEARAVGVTLAWPVATWGFAPARSDRPEVYLRWAQAF